MFLAGEHQLNAPGKFCHLFYFIFFFKERHSIEVGKTNYEEFFALDEETYGSTRVTRETGGSSPNCSFVLQHTIYTLR